jgi:hypothetical protein
MMEETPNGLVLPQSIKDTPQLYRDVNVEELQQGADACLANVSSPLFPLSVDYYLFPSTWPLGDSGEHDRLRVVFHTLGRTPSITSGIEKREREYQLITQRLPMRPPCSS